MYFNQWLPSLLRSAGWASPIPSLVHSLVPNACASPRHPLRGQWWNNVPGQQISHYLSVCLKLPNTHAQVSSCFAHIEDHFSVWNNCVMLRPMNMANWLTMLDALGDWCARNSFYVFANELRLHACCSLLVLFIDSLRHLLLSTGIWGDPADSLQAKLHRAYLAFKSWCSASRIACSQPAFQPKQVTWFFSVNLI